MWINNINVDMFRHTRNTSIDIIAFYINHLQNRLRFPLLQVTQALSLVCNQDR